MLEVATICVQTGLNAARHILESLCQYVRCHCLKNKHSLFQSTPIHFPTILCEITHYTNTHEQQPYCVGTLSQMTERSAERRVRQETGWLAGGPLLRLAKIRRTTDTHLLTYLLTYLHHGTESFLRSQPVNFAASQEIPRIYGTRKSLTVPTSARHLSLS